MGMRLAQRADHGSQQPLGAGAHVHRLRAQPQSIDADHRSAVPASSASQAAQDAAEAQLKAAQAGRDQAQAGARQSALAQGFTRVTAPFDGIVRETLADSGDLAVPGKPLLVLYAPSPLRAVVQIGASRAAEARSAQRIEIEGPGGQRVTPRQVQALPMADAASQTIEWRLELPTDDPARDWVPGQQVRVSFGGAAAAPASPSASASGPATLLIPAAAVLRRGELSAVYVVTPQGFALRAVRLRSSRGAAGIEVLAGLSGGERIALDPVRAGLAGARAAAETR